MKEFEYHIPPEAGGMPPENIPLPKEINTFPEMNPVSPEYNMFSEESGFAGTGRQSTGSTQSSRSSDEAAAGSCRRSGAGTKNTFSRTGANAFRMFIHTLYFRLWVDTARIPDVEVEVEPGSGWTLLNGQTAVNRGSLTSADPYVLVSYGLVPDDPSQIKAGEKYTYTVVVRYNGEEIRREKWSFVFNEIADPITNSTITVTKEG